MIKPININCGGRGVGFQMDLDPGCVADCAIAWYLQQGYPPEPEVVQLMSKVVQPGDLVIDAGANVGFFTLLLSQYVGATGKVIAVEPGENNLPKLTANMRLNHKMANIQLCDSPLAATPSTVQFHLCRDSGINARWRNDAAVLATQEMQAMTLDVVCPGTPKLIKMDIEGSELDALKGAEALLARHPPFIVLELNEGALKEMGATPTELREFMRKRGYEMFVLSEHGLLPALVPQFSSLQVTRNNTNVLFSTMQDIGKAWPEVSV